MCKRFSVQTQVRLDRVPLLYTWFPVKSAQRPSLSPLLNGAYGMESSSGEVLVGPQPSGLSLMTGRAKTGFFSCSTGAIALSLYFPLLSLLLEGRCKALTQPQTRVGQTGHPNKGMLGSNIPEIACYR